MERKIVKKIGNLEMDDKGVVYKTAKGGFIAPPLPEEEKIPYPKKEENDEHVCGVYNAEIEYAALYDDIDQMNAFREVAYQKDLKQSYQEMQKIFRKQERRRITRKSIAFVVKALRQYREYRRQ